MGKCLTQPRHSLHSLSKFKCKFKKDKGKEYCIRCIIISLRLKNNVILKYTIYWNETLFSMLKMKKNENNLF